MGKLVVSLDGVVIKEVQITKDKTTLGRRPYNDMVIDNLAVSGEHAVLQMVGNDVFIEDLNSTNGTYINGKAIKKQLLAHNDTVEIGKYKIKYLTDDNADYEKTVIMRPGSAAQPPAFSSTLPPNSGFGGLGPAPGQPGVDQGAERRRVGPRSHADQGGHHGGQARRAGGFDHAAALGLCVRPCRRQRAAGGQRHAAGWRIGAAAQWRRDRAGRHADAVHPALVAPAGGPRGPWRSSRSAGLLQRASAGTPRSGRIQRLRGSAGPVTMAARWPGPAAVVPMQVGVDRWTRGD